LLTHTTQKIQGQHKPLHNPNNAFINPANKTPSRTKTSDTFKNLKKNLVSLIRLGKIK